jgi:tRNA(fMet)-specific endonuclease VapC
MTAFDNDVLTDLLNGRADYQARLAAIPADQQCVPVVVAEEMIRGRLDSIRRAEAGRGPMSVIHAYDLFGRSILALHLMRLLPYTNAADALFQAWKPQKLRVGTHDLRIAAIAIAHGATLVSRNRRDYDRVPGLLLDVWN